MSSTYNSNFPALLYPGLTSRRNSTQLSLTSPKYPDYLELTLYGDLAIEQYDLQHHKMAHDHDHSAAIQDQLAQLDLRLPTFWNVKVTSKNIDIGKNGLDLTYIGPGKQETHAALARADFSMKHQCGIYYFEIKILSKGEDGYMGIGFCCAENSLERLPGLDICSWGYHGNYGQIFAGSNVGQDYGPCFITDDVIGCGVNFADRSAFYTKNGKFLGTAFRGIDTTKDLYPSVGLRTTGEKVTVNFGHEPFIYDIENYIKEQKQLIIQNTKLKNTTQPSFSSDQLVLFYLIHHGYTKTASALAMNNKIVCDSYRRNLVDCSVGIKQRTAIRTAIVNDKMDEAFELIEIHFSTILEEQENSISLLLKCGKFIEMMRKYCECVQRGTHYHEKATDSRFTRRRLNYTEVTRNPTDSDLPEQGTRGKRAYMVDIVEFNEPTEKKCDSAVFLENIMRYGQQIQEEYKYDRSEQTKKILRDIFSLLAYPDPYNSPVAHIMSASRRDALATKVNSAILAFLRQPETPALERIYRQLALTYRTLAIEGDGKSALIKLDDNHSRNIEKINTFIT